MDKLIGKDSLGAIALAAVLGLGAAFVWLTTYMFVFAAFQAWMQRLVINEACAVWIAAILLMSPIGLLLYCTFQEMKAFHYDSTEFFPALGQAIVNYWPQIVCICLLSAVLALWCYRRQRRYSAHGAAMWTCFVVVVGVPGMIGYLLHRTWITMERCRQCGNKSPRDRGACLFCDAEFPTPPLKGIEIFA